MARRSAIPARRDGDALRTFLRYIEDIEQAVLQRDGMRVTALLRKRTATHMPREVREELLAFTRAGRDSLRAPVRFLRFQHRMIELAAGGERLLTAQTELRLEAPAPVGVVRRLVDRRAAACEPTENSDDEPPA